MAFDLGVFLTVVGAVHADPRQPVARRPQGRADDRAQPTSHGHRPAAGRRRCRRRAEMELLVASAVGVLTAAGIYLAAARADLPGGARA